MHATAHAELAAGPLQVHTPTLLKYRRVISLLSETLLTKCLRPKNMAE